VEDIPAHPFSLVIFLAARLGARARRSLSLHPIVELVAFPFLFLFPPSGAIRPVSIEARADDKKEEKEEERQHTTILSASFPAERLSKPGQTQNK
jgi:hypothetical protein